MNPGFLIIGLGVAVLLVGLALQALDANQLR
jgi:hypothetical protein